ncbi:MULTISPECIES: SRPBCC family protein [unclassified Rhodococcus (in: high G+C Gram-positive bacteria)]|uniref:SRPBCC family protein n=1 Tax=unclassified Rhodococcus (in: high G+C Gram-positive bacteria) TaxID=192944 RepID=UPI00146A2E0C|nr:MULTISPECIES: SRPBCC family protein [unclassified Rhodococcus (in: high G+C Gram-positive bacteria)]MBF0663470.1 SRPBCC family protein [Rhodococcus sp. (in: high G+C Gram-positive bacteria)]NMD94589.1 SRPBCC family protein [Rhodococcus sp. BL-253-APC-6A1W]NME78283.1 SRPBCC family protein [Rhodococcus sp. 105337]
MTTPKPTGKLVNGSEGLDLVVTRTLPGSVYDAWASITEPERTARWVGRWEGTGAVGETIRVQMGFEEGAPWEDVEITECDAPHRLGLRTISEQGAWDVSFELSEDGERSEIRFVHHRVAAAEVGDVGPGWEYYLDQLVASVSGAPLRSFDDYFPAQREYFEEQTR